MKTDIYYRLDPAPLAEMVAWDRRRRRKPAVVVASAGTVSSGAVDPLEELADLCAEEGMWLHVDGAYGALAAAAPSGAWMRPALARADSLSLDPHKWLFVPIDTSCLLVRDPDHLRRFFSLVPEYLKVSREETPEDISHPMEKTIELTRRFRALRIWMTLKVFGATAIRRTIEAHLRMARKFASWVEASPRYQLLAPVMTSNVCLRRIPASLARPGAAGRERELERLNQEIIDRLNRGGGIFLSHCRLGGRFALRVCITHLRTGEEDIIRLWNRLEEVSLEAESELRAPPSR
jgi:aromatic-L-amino-acid decarboxylase